MADAKTILQKYLGDMVSLEGHIQKAIDMQVKEVESDHPEIAGQLSTFSTTLQSHHDALTKRLEAMGGAVNHPIKEGVAAVAGFAAGLVDKFRSEEISKDYRDNFTALNLSLISYVMLHTTALALGDRETAEIAARNVKDNANFVMEIQKLIPSIVVRELKMNHEEVSGSLQEGATDETRKLIEEIWK